VLAITLAGLASPARGEGSPDLAQRVRPVLAKCVTCHGGDTPAGELDLSTRDAALRGGESGKALVPSDAARSAIYKKIAAKKMPPKKPLTADEAALVRDWINAGAHWDGTIRAAEPAVVAAAEKGDRWAFQPLADPKPPAVKEPGGVSDPIDAFVLARLESQGLGHAPAADRRTLIRRATFDLLGLPPTPEEVDAFVADPSPAAYEALVDRLLASPHYGERWGRHWLDVARFAESHGFEYDRLRDNAWRYRDYVIRSLNADKPYDLFVREQVAGDAIEPAGADGIAATGFLVAGPWDEAGNKAQKSVVMRARLREEELEDMVSAVGQTFLGLTINCARCHDHKFDPITARDYARLKAALVGVAHGDRPALPPGEVKAREAWRAQLVEQMRSLDAESARIRAVARARITGAAESADGAPVPLVRWTFDENAQDDSGTLQSTLVGHATVAGGRLKLDGKGSALEAGPLPHAIREKTLEAWFALANLDQRGGGVITIERRDGAVFDGLVFGETVPRRWVAGSEFYRRTHDLHAPAESAGPGALVHMAVVYDAANGVTVYRNGVALAARYVPAGDEATLRTFAPADSHVLLGKRHTGGRSPFLTGEIEEARLYDRALSADEIAASFRVGVMHVTPAQCDRALSADERRALESLRAKRNAHEADLRAIAPIPLAYAANSTVPPPTHVLSRGDVERPGELIAAGGLSAVKRPSPELGLAADAPEGERRRKLAEWIVHPDNPLTARVIVNRVWHYHFGTGLVGTPNDFGTNGERPSHPELLDRLARDFLAQGGRLKALHRRIMLSSTYRQSSRVEPKAAARDAEDRLLWRFPPRRLEAESVRDAILAVSGRLDRAVGGPSFRPFTITVFNSSFYNLFDSDAPGLDRRSVYRINVNSAKDPLLETLDCPDPSVKTPRRALTTTPVQALTLMNAAFVQRQARWMAVRVRAESGDDPARQVERAYRLALGRPPTGDERPRLVSFVRKNGLENLAWVLFNANEFLALR
jgi:hypothetical protein